ncbi:MAG: helix-turn-helix domain-containing protein [Xanthobacteraceae bacterium]|jgi:IclR family transcriptional regulator, mhp operon transcriptional activator
MTKRSSSAQYSRVQGLERGLEVLRALNASTGGRNSVIRLSTETGLHRTTVKRLLETLKHLGVVRYLDDSNEYCLTLKVLQLSEGFRDVVWIAEVARPLMHALTRKVLWPSDLMILDTDELVVRETTHGITPWSFNSRVLGIRVPMLQSSGGRAYLAFCADDERERLLTMLRKRDGIEGERARDAVYVARVLNQTRERGFAVSERRDGFGNMGLRFGTNRCAAIAVPIRRKGYAVASLNLVYLTRAVSTQEIIERSLPDLIATGRRIEQGIRSEEASDTVSMPIIRTNPSGRRYAS